MVKDYKMRSRASLLLLALATGSSAAICTANAFWAAPPTVFGSEVLEIHAEEVKEWNEYATSAPTFPALPVEPKPIDLCNVTVIYTHPGDKSPHPETSASVLTYQGLNDTIRVSIWMPLKEGHWNERFLGQGGGGWVRGARGPITQ